MTEQNPAPAPAQSSVSEKSAQHSSKLVLAGVVVLIALGAFLGGMAVMNFLNSVEEGEGEKIIDSLVEADEEDEIEEELEEEIKDEEVVISVSTESELVINWIDPFEQPSVDVNEQLSQTFCPIERDSEGGILKYQPCGYPSEENQYRLGTVVGGEYEGRSLEMYTARTEGLGYFHLMIYILVDPEGIEPAVVLDQEARSTSESFSSSNTTTASDLVGWSEEDDANGAYAGMVLDQTATVPSLAPANAIQDLDGNRYLYTGAWLHYAAEKAVSPLVSSWEIQAQGGRTLTVYEGSEGSSTKAGMNQVYVIGLDGRFLWYDLEIPFYEYEIDADGDRRITQGVPGVEWSDGEVNESIYFKGALGGCGFTTATNVISEEVIDGLDIEVVGTADGVDIYEPASYELEYFADVFNIITYDDLGEEQEYEDFAYPYVYFQDALGRWVELQHAELIPPVECGKPVIYLYPEEEMELSVWVDPQGGFSYTEPVYDGGWEVLASPNGELVNLKDGKKYHYLFWEGRGDLYPQVETYWVIEQEHVESFLITQLLKMNLNKMEIVDFLTFWLPRMQEDAYYKIGFHGTEIMNELAPLSLSVDPDHVFRILMDYEGLDAWQEPNPPTRLPEANRDGFEVIEWGGVLR